MLLTLKDIYDAEVAKTSSGAAFEELKGIVIDPGDLLTITSASVENQTTAYTRLICGLLSGATFTGLWDEPTPSASQIYWNPDRFLVRAGNRFAARLYGSTDGDYIRMHIQGYIYTLGE